MVRWYRNGSVINGATADINTITEGLIIQSNLTLTSVREEHSGIYQCVFVSSGVGGVANFNSIVSSTYLLVQCKYMYIPNVLMIIVL